MVKLLKIWKILSIGRNAEPDNEQEIADSLDEVEDERNVIDLMDDEPINVEFDTSVPNIVPSSLEGNSQLIADEKDKFPTTVSGDRNLKRKRSDGDIQNYSTSPKKDSSPLQNNSTDLLLYDSNLLAPY